jgi:tRNA(fMet)-specific endonuclease VapC
MTLYILDTDHLSLYGRNHPALIERLQVASVNLTTTAINVEEQLRGRLAQVAEAKAGKYLRKINYIVFTKFFENFFNR